jgi:HK97 family phage major capsid protein
VRLSFQYGIRSAANAMTNAQHSQSGTPSVDTLVPIMAKMGKYARITDCFWVTGYHGWARLLLLKDSAGNSLILTREKVGGSDVLASGVLGTLLGYPIVVSDAWSNAMDADGIVQGTTISKTSMALVNRRMFLGGTRMAMEIDASEHVFFQYNQIALRSNLRPALTTLRVPGTANPFVGLAKDIDCFA